MGKKVFLVETNLNGWGYDVDQHAVVIEADYDEKLNLATVIAPEAFKKEWPGIIVRGSMGRWKECEGPARLLSSEEWHKLATSLQ